MLTRPEYSEKVTGEIRDEAYEAASGVIAKCVGYSKDDAELTFSVTLNEHVACAVLGNIAMNVVRQNRGTLEEYLAWVNAEVKLAYEKVMNNPDFKPHAVGGKEITEEEMFKALNITVQ